jgi:hypothetical protein
VKWHEKALDGQALSVAEKLGRTVGPDFYLAGGTGLALQIGHRISRDFDLFSSDNALRENERQRIVAALKGQGRVDVREAMNGTCHLLLDGVAVSFFLYPYALLRSPCGVFRGLPVAHVDDICAMKLSAVVGRGSKKDFVDLYHLCRKLGLKEALEIGVRKFPDHGNFLMLAARALVYFEDADKEPMPRLLGKLEWDAVKEFFEKEIPRIIRRLVAVPKGGLP